MQRFVEALRQRGFFSGLTEGSPAWTERLAKAQEKFRERHARASAPTAAQSVPGGAGAPEFRPLASSQADRPAGAGDGAAGGTAVEEARLRERLAQVTVPATISCSTIVPPEPHGGAKWALPAPVEAIPG